jgi:polyhydroxybutyrate depolymerase
MLRPTSSTLSRSRKLAGAAVLISLVAVSACSSGSGPNSPDGGGSASSNSSVDTSPAITPVELAPAVDPAGAVTHGTLTFDGRERTYRLYVPSSLPAGPAPLFIGLHGGTGWADQFAATNHIEGLAESNGFIVVHPDGVKVPGQRGGVWNGGLCCAIAVRENVDDVGFVNALIVELAEKHEIDPKRIFAFGHSNGAIMSYRLACELGNRIAGIGVVAGTLGVESCDPSQPVSVIHVHGSADQSILLEGGAGPNSIAGVDFPPPRAGFDTLAARDGCPDPKESTEGDIATARREPCAADAAATFVTIATANHAWPGGTPIVTPSAGEGYADYDATAELVAFLLSHPRP